MLHCCITYPNLLRSILMLGVGPIVFLFYVTTSYKLTHSGQFVLFVMRDANTRRLVLSVLSNFQADCGTAICHDLDYASRLDGVGRL